MSYITSSIVASVQKRIRDPAYDTSEIIEYCNDTQNDIFNEYRLNFMEKYQDYTTAASVEDITNGTGLPTDYLIAIDLLNITNGAHNLITYLDVVPRDQLDTTTGITTITTTSTTTPEGWYKYAGKILMYHPPASILTVRLRYYKMPTLLTTDDTILPALPYSFREIYVLGAAYRVLQIKDNYDQAGILQNKYDEILAKLVGQTAVNQVGQSAQQRLNRQTVRRRSF